MVPLLCTPPGLGDTSHTGRDMPRKLRASPDPCKCLLRAGRADPQAHPTPHIHPTAPHTDPNPRATHRRASAEGIWHEEAGPESWGLPLSSAFSYKMRQHPDVCSTLPTAAGLEKELCPHINLPLQGGTARGPVVFSRG